MPKYRNVSGEARSVAVLNGRWVDTDEVITVPDHLSEPHLIWPADTWERVDATKSKKES